MSEEETKAIEYLKGKFESFEEDDTLAKWDYEAINTMLGLIDKLQKELKDSINARFELQRRIDKLQKENEELKEKLKSREKQIKLMQQCDLAKELNKLQEENEKLKYEHLEADELIKTLRENNLSYQEELAKAWEENAELKEEIKDLIEENHKHIDYIANMKKKHEDKIRTKIKELEETTAEELRYDFLMNRDEVKNAFIRILEELLN